jgi:hypothetical protein
MRIKEGLSWLDIEERKSMQRNKGLKNQGNNTVKTVLIDRREKSQVCHLETIGEVWSRGDQFW